jgi:hypothetical protein
MQCIEGGGGVRERKFAQQLLGGGDLVGLLVDIDMRQDQAGLGVERVQQLSRLTVPELVETAPQRLAIQRGEALRKINRTVQKTHCMPAESLFDSFWIQALEDGANGGMGEAGQGSVGVADGIPDEGGALPG